MTGVLPAESLDVHSRAPFELDPGQVSGAISLSFDPACTRPNYSFYIFYGNTDAAVDICALDVTINPVTESFSYSIADPGKYTSCTWSLQATGTVEFTYGVTLPAKVRAKHIHT